MHGTASSAGFRSGKLNRAGVPRQRAEIPASMRGQMRKERGGLASDRRQQKTLRVGGGGGSGGGGNNDKSIVMPDMYK